MRLIFCLTTGRTATMYLAHILDSLPGVVGLHEPEPYFHHYQVLPFFERCQWLTEQKLPEIQHLAERNNIYAETSNLFNQGWVECFLWLKIPFDAIWLRRPMDQVAISFWRKNIIPGRTALSYHMRPDHPENVLRAAHWEHWTDYTCCLWLAMEKEARNEKYKPLIEEAGGRVVETWTGEIMSEAGFIKLLKDMDLPMPDGAYHEIKNERLNSTAEKLRSYWPPDGLGEQKKIILEAIR